MFSVAPCCCASAGVGIANVHPVPWLSGWACTSCPRPNVHATRLHAVCVPSSGSLVVTENGTAWPQSKNAPSGGVATVTVGATLPTLTALEVSPILPPGSVTRRRATCRPSVVYVCDAETPVASNVPSPSKSHSYVRAAPSGSLDADPSNPTVSGAALLLAGSAEILACGDLFPGA